jgi:hypothetical protein
LDQAAAQGWTWRASGPTGLRFSPATEFRLPNWTTGFLVWSVGRLKGSVTETSLRTSPLGVANVIALARKRVFWGALLGVRRRGWRSLRFSGQLRARGTRARQDNIGTTSSKRAPCGLALWWSSSPPWAWAYARAMESPRPAPDFPAARALRSSARPGTQGRADGVRLAARPLTARAGRTPSCACGRRRSGPDCGRTPSSFTRTTTAEVDAGGVFQYGARDLRAASKYDAGRHRPPVRGAQPRSHTCPTARLAVRFVAPIAACAQQRVGRISKIGRSPDPPAQPAS